MLVIMLFVLVTSSCDCVFCFFCRDGDFILGAQQRPGGKKSFSSEAPTGASWKKEQKQKSMARTFSS